MMIFEISQIGEVFRLPMEWVKLITKNMVHREIIILGVCYRVDQVVQRYGEITVTLVPGGD